jgi:hypothetical protein
MTGKNSIAAKHLPQTPFRHQLFSARREPAETRLRLGLARQYDLTHHSPAGTFDSAFSNRQRSQHTSRRQRPGTLVRGQWRFQPPSIQSVEKSGRPALAITNP